METIICGNCTKKHVKKSLKRSCGNCFVCTSCEIYQCPDCRAKIIITPMREPNV